MKDVITVIAFALIEISLFGLSALLIYKQVPGWGWFLFVAMLIGGSIRIKTSS